MWFSQRRAERAPTVAGTLVSASWLVFGMTTLLLGVSRVAGTVPSIRVQSLAYLALMVGVSLPHGGFEHVENLRGRGEQFQGTYVAGYLLLTAVSLAVFLVAPVAGLGLALTVTALKGGHGGVRVLESVAGARHLQAPLPRAVAVAVRGGAIIVVPYVASPDVYFMVASYMVGFVEPGALQGFLWMLEPTARAGVGGVYAGLVVAHLAAGWVRAGETSGWRADAIETLLLASFFAVVPPILAIGLYFPCWYALRQVARLSGAAATGQPTASVSVGDTLWQFVRRATLPWVGAVVILVGMTRVVPNPPVGAVTWMAFYSVFVAVIAVPHVVVGGWLDRQQGIWAVTTD
ncbi:Brp/Blh family beta-carotene 15,15'-dioxygenase [Salinibaculum rarum]|uniref:Brp/Blh family beta-carotene 15,15'-dioxygenase n=1 Tax=Salinibaculum rarum TaxID=3058903 RepID=UPI00265FCB15|nr:Brp/Blh family beta-carotene 15,15'-dioxygenase [Salinibaculum sp. KK48]